MAPPQFQPPFTPQQAPSKWEALNSTLGPTLANLPASYLQFRAANQKNKNELMKLQLEYQQLQDAHLKAQQAAGTGAPTPQIPGGSVPFNPPPVGGTLNPGSLSLPPQPLGGAQPGGMAGALPPVTTGNIQPPSMTTTQNQPMTPEQEGLPAFTNRVGTTAAAIEAPLLFQKPTGQDSTLLQRVDANGQPVGEPTSLPGKHVIVTHPQPSTGAGAAVKSEAELRKEFVSATKEQKAILEQSSKAISLAGQESPTADAALAFALTRGAMGGAGRITQTEIAQFGPQLGNYPDVVQQFLLKASKGERYDPKIRADVVATVKQQAQQAEDNLVSQENVYRDMAKSYKMNPERVVPNQRPASMKESHSFNGVPVIGGDFNGAKVTKVTKLK